MSYSHYYIEPFEISENKRVSAKYDDQHITTGSYAYNTEEETRKEEIEEIDNLDSGKWVALVLITEERCTSCEYWHETDSIHGYVTVNDEDAVRKMLKTGNY